MVTSVRVELPQFTGYLLRRAYVKATLSARACVDQEIPVREVAMLAILAERGAVSQRALSDLTGVNRTIMVKVVDDLEARGWVVRERNADDRRSYALRLTAGGSAALDRLLADLDRGELLLTESLTKAERARLRSVLSTLLDGEAWLAIESLSRYAGFLIAQAHRVLRQWALEALAPLGLDPRDFGVLSAIASDQPCSQNHLAQALGVSPPAALSFVADLEGAGLVRRERNPDDRRCYDLTLTPAGLKRLGLARAAAAEVQARVADRLGKRADAELRSLLARVVAD